MLSFSQRRGFKPVRMALQVDGMDDDLRTAIWNYISEWVLPDGGDISSDYAWDTIGVPLWREFLKRPVDTMSNGAYQQLREWYFKADWYEVYDLLEFLMAIKKGDAAAVLNVRLESELSGYRLVGGAITPITDEHELETIEEAIGACQNDWLRPIRVHLTTAVGHLSRRPNPDFRNSIKESISAVEGICGLISGKPKASLKEALSAIEQDDSVQIHRGLKRGFEAIYGYTSDAGGIRHDLMGEQEPEFEDAKYMLVACSGFVNYLIAKAVKANVKLS